MYDPTRLAALVAVAEAGSITRAAARLGYTAPHSPSSWPSWSGRPVRRCWCATIAGHG